MQQLQYNAACIGKKRLAGVSVKDCTPINEIIAEIGRLGTTLEE